MASMNSDIRLPSRSKRTLVVLLAAAIVAFALAFAVSLFSFTVASADVANCSTGIGSPLLVDVVQQISNDPDSGFHGNWAIDNFTRHIRIWAEGDHYCGQADDQGTFTTFGGASGVSPQNGTPLPQVVVGTMVGGTHGVLTGTLGDAGNWGTTGTAPAQDCHSADCSMTSLWVNNYFPGGNYAYSPSPADSTGDWSWTYTATTCGYGAWTNGNAGSHGDIAASSNSCPEAYNQHLVTEAGVATSTTLTGNDPDEDPLDFTISMFPANGTLTCDGGSCTDEPLATANVTYTPNPGFSGDDEFDFTASDGEFENDATVTIHVNAAAPSCINTTTFDAFNLGSVNGQGGWTSTGAYDQAVVSNTYGFATFGCKTLRISNSVTSGSFGDQTFSPSTSSEAGETDAQTSSYSGGTRQNHFEGQFDLASAVPGAMQTGLVMSVSPDRGDGARMGYLRFEDQADGIHVFADDYIDAAPQGTLSNPAQGCGVEDDWTDTDIATLDRTAPHTIKFSIDFVDGPGNDVLKVYVDGVLKHTGTTWEDYFRWCTESGGGVVDDTSADVSRTVDSLLFREGGTAAPANAGKGFLIDNVAISTGATPVVDPTCVSGQHLENHVCVADAGGNGGGGSSANTNTGNGGGGGTVVGLIGTVNTNPTGTNTNGQVLGASTDLPAGCSVYLDGYIKKGSTNTSLIKKLQLFLNSNLSLSIPVTGVFGPMTLDAVNKFQVKYADEILKPWFDKGLSKDMNPSGYVYKTTARMINLLQCSTLEIPQPQLP